MRRYGKLAAWTLVLVAGLSLWTLAQGLTADEILAQVEEKSFIGTEIGSIAGTLELAITEEGETLNYTFRVFGQQGEENQPDKFLMVYLEPELVSGTMFLGWRLPDGDTKMWLYLPDLGLVKEIVGEAREQEFISGSGITYDDIAQGFSFREDYDAELAGEEEVNGVSCYVLVLTQKPGHETDYSQIKLWVDKEHFNVMKMESYKDGELTGVMVGSDLREDSIGYIPHHYQFQDLEEDKTAEITIVDRQAKEIPDDYFDPEKLPTLEIEGL